MRRKVLAELYAFSFSCQVRRATPGYDIDFDQFLESCL